MALAIQVLAPHIPASNTPGVPLTSAFASYGSFYVRMRVSGAVPPFPLRVTITETPRPAVGPAAFRVGGGRILKLDQPARIYNSTPFAGGYQVSRVRDFELRSSPVWFLVEMDTGDTATAAFNGSVMRVTVAGGQGYQESAEIEVRNSNPNNHFHWRSQPEFVDGAYFKCVHVDASGLATPFFFLYGVNKPAGGANSESFAIFGKGGSMRAGAVVDDPDPIYQTYPAGDYAAERLYGLDAKVHVPEFSASDIRCSGDKQLAGGHVSWDLVLSNLHTHCRTDWNPLEPMQRRLPGFGETEVPGMPLMKHTDGFPAALPVMTAYYMSHNMNCFASGTVNWKGTQYNFSDHKGYQDSNWGAGGFPHPYVWMQANDFVENGIPQYGTSLVALYTPAMPLVAGSTPVGGICLRHNGVKYEIVGVDPAAFVAGGMVSPLGSYILQRQIRELGVVECSVDFRLNGVRKTVDMTKGGAEVTQQIGGFPRAQCPGDGTCPPGEALPVRWYMHGLNGQNDEITIVAECAARSVMCLHAPLNGRMVSCVTKESLLVRFTVQLKPRGGNEITLVSEIGTAEYGD